MTMNMAMVPVCEYGSGPGASEDSIGHGRSNRGAGRGGERLGSVAAGGGVGVLRIRAGGYPLLA